MKTRNYHKTPITSAVAIFFMIGLLFSAFFVNKIYLKKLNELQYQLMSTKEELSIYQDAYKEALANAQYEYEINKNLEIDLAELQATVESLKSQEYEIIYMGDFKITYYCDERKSHICGGNGITASGEETVVGITAAADWSILPKGSKVYIESVGFREIQDVGGAVEGNHIDILVETHDDAISRGIHNEGVWLLIEKDY